MSSVIQFPTSAKQDPASAIPEIWVIHVSPKHNLTVECRYYDNDDTCYDPAFFIEIYASSNSQLSGLIKKGIQLVQGERCLLERSRWARHVEKVCSVKTEREKGGSE